MLCSHLFLSSSCPRPHPSPGLPHPHREFQEPCWCSDHILWPLLSRSECWLTLWGRVPAWGNLQLDWEITILSKSVAVLFFVFLKHSSLKTQSCRQQPFFITWSRRQSQPIERKGSAESERSRVGDGSEDVSVLPRPPDAWDSETFLNPCFHHVPPHPLQSLLSSNELVRCDLARW